MEHQTFCTLQSARHERGLKINLRTSHPIPRRCHGKSLIHLGKSLLGTKMPTTDQMWCSAAPKTTPQTNLKWSSQSMEEDNCPHLPHPSRTELPMLLSDNIPNPNWQEVWPISWLIWKHHKCHKQYLTKRKWTKPYLNTVALILPKLMDLHLQLNHSAICCSMME